MYTHVQGYHISNIITEELFELKNSLFTSFHLQVFKDQHAVNEVYLNFNNFLPITKYCSTQITLHLEFCLYDSLACEYT